MTTESVNAAVTPPAPPPTPEPILQLAMRFMASKHLFAANAIGLFEHLAEGPTTLDEVAPCASSRGRGTATPTGP